MASPPPPAQPRTLHLPRPQLLSPPQHQLQHQLQHPQPPPQLPPLSQLPPLLLPSQLLVLPQHLLPLQPLRHNLRLLSSHLQVEEALPLLEEHLLEEEAQEELRLAEEAQVASQQVAEDPEASQQDEEAQEDRLREEVDPLLPGELRPAEEPQVVRQQEEEVPHQQAEEDPEVSRLVEAPLQVSLQVEEAQHPLEAPRQVEEDPPPQEEEDLRQLGAGGPALQAGEDLHPREEEPQLKDREEAPQLREEALLPGEPQQVEGDQPQLGEEAHHLLAEAAHRHREDRSQLRIRW